jgi:ABC-type multidrug transport system permease subunit
MVAACFKTESAATSLAGVVVVVVALFTGYTIPKPDIPGALRWIMYINVRFSIANCWLACSPLVCSPCAMVSRLC